MSDSKNVPFNNRNLFSNHYLQNSIQVNSEWMREDHQSAFTEIKKIYDQESPFLQSLKERQLEDRFFQPIFKIMGFEYEVTETTRAREFPDYAFFSDRKSLDDAHTNKGMLSFFINSIAIGEVKQWTVDLDKFGRYEHPSNQLYMYLHDTNQKWGILSNGRLWRIYCKDRARDEYFEVDLPSLLLSNNIEDFKYFYYFFRKEAFIVTKDGKAFLERVLNGSTDYAREIGDDLKKNVYQAMLKISEGFIEWKQNRIDIEEPSTLLVVQKNTMILLYRFLFLLYAEGKGLLDLDEPQYREIYSFYRLKNEVAERIDGPAHQRYLPSTHSLSTRLRYLFRLIDQGSEAIGIPKDQFFIPPYNGGLFDPIKHPELEKWDVGDSYLAESIDLLSRSKLNGSQRDFIDYSMLKIHHLGSIYEGLLEMSCELHNRIL